MIFIFLSGKNLKFDNFSWFKRTVHAINTWTFKIIIFDNYWNCINFGNYLKFWLNKENWHFQGKNGSFYTNCNNNFIDVWILRLFTIKISPILTLVWTMSWFISPLPGNLVKIIFQLWPCIPWKVLFGLSDMFSVQFISQPWQLLKLYQFRELSEILIEQRKLTFSMEKMAVFTQTVIITSLMYGYWGWGTPIFISQKNSQSL
jgi:hypothetical protein